jgi:UDP-glucuronate decarboxylase
MTLYGDGNQTRSLCFVNDLIEGLVLLMESPPTFAGPVNLGDPVEYTMRELAELVLKETGSRSKFVDDPRQRQKEVAWRKQGSDEAKGHVGRWIIDRRHVPHRVIKTSYSQNELETV